MFGSIEVKTRPIKLAHLVDPGNSHQVREAIRLSSTLWGGAYFPIIPLYKKMPPAWKDPFKAPAAKPVVLGYLKAFDPDFLVQFSAQVPEFVAAAGIRIIKPSDVWTLTGTDQNLAPRFGIGIFELANKIFDEHFKYRQKYPVRVVVPKIPKELSLFWASVFGEFPADLSSLFEKAYTEPLEIQAPDFHRDHFAELFRDDVLFPRRITQYGLELVNRAGFHGRTGRLHFLDASKPEDIVDFWNLRCLGGMGVLPVPKQLQDNAQLSAVVVEFLKRNRRPWKHQPGVYDQATFVRSRHSTMDEMQAYAQKLGLKPEPGNELHGHYYSLQHWYPRIWDEWASDKDGAIPDDAYGEKRDSIELSDSEGLAITFRPLLPDFAYEFSFHEEPRCANEIRFSVYAADEYIAEAFPKWSGPNFGRSISSLASFRDDWRVGRNGLVRLVKDTIAERRTIPTAESIAFAWLKDNGWKPELSAPGILGKQIYQALGGHTLLLKNENLLGLLEHMNGGTVKRDGTPAEENRFTNDRDLTVGEVKKRLEGSSRNANLYEYLVSKGIFKLGVRIQCPRCIRHSWFSVETIRESFTCPRCLNVFPALGNLDSGVWSLKTAGPFSVPGYADGAYAVLLTLDLLADRNLPTLQTTPVVSFTAKAGNRSDIEADFAMFWQEAVFGERKEGLMFGECKTYDLFKTKDFKRMESLAGEFPGAVLLFSTLRKSLTKQEVAGIGPIAKKGRKRWKPERPVNPVMILTGTELLGMGRPPYCWDESVRKKFHHLRGVIGLCDATQQLYLGLPSWQTEWHNKWEKGRARLQAKQTQSAPGQP
jgi:hypothetical protein